MTVAPASLPPQSRRDSSLIAFGASVSGGRPPHILCSVSTLPFFSYPLSIRIRRDFLIAGWASSRFTLHITRPAFRRSRYSEEARASINTNGHQPTQRR